MRRPVLVLALVLAACRSDGERPAPAPDPARALCEAGGDEVASATPATVGAVRAWVAGPNRRPAAHAFPGAADSDAAAWCWSPKGGGWDAYAAGPGGATFPLAHVGGMPHPPGGPPTVP